MRIVTVADAGETDIDDVDTDDDGLSDAAEAADLDQTFQCKLSQRSPFVLDVPGQAMADNQASRTGGNGADYVRGDRFTLRQLVPLKPVMATAPAMVALYRRWWEEE